MEPHNNLPTLALNDGIMLLRLGNFIWATTAQSAVIFLPLWQDVLLATVLLLTTTLPRIIWPSLWRNSKRGANLKIFVL